MNLGASPSTNSELSAPSPQPSTPGRRGLANYLGNSVIDVASVATGPEQRSLKHQVEEKMQSSGSSVNSVPRPLSSSVGVTTRSGARASTDSITNALPDLPFMTGIRTRSGRASSSSLPGAGSPVMDKKKKKPRAKVQGKRKPRAKKAKVPKKPKKIFKKDIPDMFTDKDTVLKLTLRRHPFDLMINEFKQSEFRETKKWIQSRLYDLKCHNYTQKVYKYVLFQNGYSSTSPWFATTYAGFTFHDELEPQVFREGHPDTMTIKGPKIYEIHLGPVMGAGHLPEDMIDQYPELSKWCDDPAMSVDGSESDARSSSRGGEWSSTQGDQTISDISSSEAEEVISSDPSWTPSVEQISSSCASAKPAAKRKKRPSICLDSDESEVEVVNHSRAAPKRKVAQAPLRKGSSKGKLSEKSDGETAKKAAEQEERERLEQVEIAEKKRAWRARQDEKRRQKEAEDAEADRRMREHHEILRRQRDERANREKELFVSKWQ